MLAELYEHGMTGYIPQDPVESLRWRVSAAKLLIDTKQPTNSKEDIVGFARKVMLFASGNTLAID